MSVSRNCTRWVQDKGVEGLHNLVPRTCEEYIARLEAEVSILSGADSSRLERIQRAYGRLSEVSQGITKAGSGFCPETCNWPHVHHFESRGDDPWPPRQSLRTKTVRNDD